MKIIIKITDEKKKYNPVSISVCESSSIRTYFLVYHLKKISRVCNLFPLRNFRVYIFMERFGKILWYYAGEKTLRNEYS